MDLSTFSMEELQLLQVRLDAHLRQSRLQVVLRALAVRHNAGLMSSSLKLREQDLERAIMRRNTNNIDECIDILQHLLGIE